ncbi:DUF2200 domain-containing protein [Burkholderiaceae bacterium DAT-1]|nr:DUF2200 domain-containing protein [Burkholderiaceae bacterium DAT-1]
MASREIGKISFTKVYPLYVQKVVRKQRTQAEVDTVICWLTGFSSEQLAHHISHEIDFESFFAQAPAMHPNCILIKGVVCGVRVEEIADPLTRHVRYLDKLIDELAKGKALDSILRK